MNSFNSPSAGNRSRDSKKSKAPLVSAENANREKAKLKQGRDRLENERTADETSARTSVIGGRIS